MIFLTYYLLFVPNWPSKSRLVITNHHDRDFVHLYEARITSDLLRSLECPKTIKSCVDWPAIKRTRIPFQPVNSFHQRLQIELLAPRKA